MEKQSNSAPCQSIQGKLVHLVSLYGRVQGVYEKSEDAYQVWHTFILKGQVAELSSTCIK